MGSLNAMTPYQKTFGLNGAGSSTGLIFIIYNLGQIAAFPFCGVLAEGYASLLDASLSWLERLSRHLPMRGDNSLVAGSFLVSAHLWPLQQDQHILLSLLTPHTVAQWLECEFVQDAPCLD
jgi:hypothetical protein